MSLPDDMLQVIKKADNTGLNNIIAAASDAEKNAISSREAVLLLKNAVDTGRLPLLETLLSVEVIKNHVGAHNNTVLEHATTFSAAKSQFDFRILEILLQMDSVINQTNIIDLFKKIASGKQIKVFELFLKTSVIQNSEPREYASLLNHFILESSFTPLARKKIDLLLSLPGLQEAWGTLKNDYSFTLKRYISSSALSSRLEKILEIEDVKHYADSHLGELLEYAIEHDSKNFCFLLNTLNTHKMEQESYLRLVRLAVKNKDVLSIYTLNKIALKNQKKIDFTTAILDNETSQNFLTEVNRYSQVACSLEDGDFRMKLINQFIQGMGHIYYDGGLLAIAATNQQKITYSNYQVNPTILDGEEELSIYLSTIKNAEFPLQERFVLSSTHWVCGEIIMSEGSVQLLFIDSIAGDWNVQEPPFIKAAKAIFPEVTIYFDTITRQKSSAGCSIFALDDVRHLYTINRYLPGEYKNLGLFAYLANQPSKVNNNVHYISLPLPFMRTAQTSKLIDETNLGLITSRSLEEQMTVVNKKGQYPLAAAQTFFTADGKLTNKRLEAKLNQFKQRSIDYLLGTPSEEIRKDMDKYSLNHFMNTINERALSDHLKPLV